MSRRRPSFSIDPASGRPMLGAGGQPVRPTLIEPGPAMPVNARGAPPLEQIIPYLISRGARPQLQVGFTGDGQVAFTAICGPIQIPVTIALDVFDASLVPALQQAYDRAAENLAAQQQPELPEVPADTEDLLDAAIAAVAPTGEPRRIILPGE
jgi:hypothetical protein